MRGVISVLFFYACSPAETTSPLTRDYTWYDTEYAPPPVEVEETTPCGNRVVSTLPALGEDRAFYLSPVEATLYNPEPNASITLRTGLGIEWPGYSAVEGSRVRFVGEPLNPSTDYVMTVDYGCGQEEIAFRTSVVGTPVEPSSLVDRTYVLQLPLGTWVQPSNASAGVGAIFSEVQLILGVRGYSTGQDTLTMSIGALVYGAQYPCFPTVRLDDVPLDNPLFDAEVPFVAIETQSFSLSLREFELTGAFAPDGTFIQGATLSGRLDTRDMGSPLGVDSVCAVLETFGVACGACPDGEVACLDIDVKDVPAPEIPIVLQEISEEDVANNTLCY